MTSKRLALAPHVPALALRSGAALAADDSKVKAATNQVETGYGKIAEGVGDTAYEYLLEVTYRPRRGPKLPI
jgi:hypothetical protein